MELFVQHRRLDKTGRPAKLIFSLYERPHFSAVNVRNECLPV